MSKKIVIDTETTGFNAKTDELLQVSIIDTDGNVLFDSFFKPTRHSEWKEAENVNGISPEMVANSPTIDEKIAVINDILRLADEVIGYNTGFDIGFLESNGATFKAEYKVVDVMKLFAPVYGVWSEEQNDYKWQKLTTAAEYFNYDWSKRAETAHNSLGDCFATLFVYENINRL